MIDHSVFGEVKLSHEDELRDHVGLPGHRDGGDVQDEQYVPAGESDLGEAVGGEAAGEHLQDGDSDRQDQRVSQPCQHVRLLPDL